MPITEAQRQERTRYLCASDMPIILGLSPYNKTPGDVYFSKVYNLPMEDTNEPTEAQNTGNLLEDPLLDWASKQLGGVELVRQPWYVCQDGPAAGVFAAHPDAVIVNKPEGLEAKYANAAMGQSYGEEGSDVIPDHVIIQAQHQMLSARLNRIWVPVAIAGYSLQFKLFQVPRDEELIGMIVNRGMGWWRKHITGYVEQDGTFVHPVRPDECDAPPMDLIKRVRREPESWTELPADAERLVFEYRKANYRMKEAEEEKSAAQAALLNLLGTAEAGHMSDGTDITYMEQKSAPRCDYTLLRAKYPEAFASCVTQGTHRTMRIKEPKRAKGDGLDKLVA